MKRRFAFVLAEIIVSMTILALSLSPFLWNTLNAQKQYAKCINELESKQIADEALAIALSEYSLQQHTFHDALEIRQSETTCLSSSGTTFIVKRTDCPLQTNKEKKDETAPISLRVKITIEIYSATSFLTERSAQICLKKGVS